MTKSELVKIIAEKSNNTIKNVDLIMKLTIDEIINQVNEGEEVKFIGFANFKRVTKAACTKRNPATGGTVDLPERNVAKVTLANNFKKLKLK